MDLRSTVGHGIKPSLMKYVHVSYRLMLLCQQMHMNDLMCAEKRVQGLFRH